MWRAYLFGKEKLKTNIQISTISIACIAQIGIGKAFFIRSIINTKKKVILVVLMYSIHCIRIVFSISFYAYITSVQSGNSVLEL